LLLVDPKANFFLTFMSLYRLINQKVPTGKVNTGPNAMGFCGDQAYGGQGHS